MSFTPTFGSIGDIIAVAQIVAKITSALSDSRGSAVEYQQLFAELRSLQNAIDHLEKLSPRSGGEIKTLESIKFAAAACRRPLEAFQKKMENYHRFLGGDTVHSDDSDDCSTYSNAESSGKGKGKFSLKKKLGLAATKIQWEFTMKNEVQKLQNYLSLHVDTINTLLVVHGLETMEFDAVANRGSHDELKVLINGTQRTLERVSGNLDAQFLLAKNTSNTVEKLLGVVMEWNAPWKMINDLVSKICISTQKIYGVLLEIKGCAVDVRWSFFQAPVLVEDALGEKFPVPSEYDFSLLQEIILHRFSDGGQVSSMVHKGDYELSYAGNSSHILSGSLRLRPGSQVIMAVIITQTEETVACPIPTCRSREYQTLQSGGFRCSVCNIWFDKSTQTAIQEIVEDNDILSSQTVENKQIKQTSRNQKNQNGVEPFGDTKRKRPMSCSQRHLEELRNIRLRQICSEQTHRTLTSMANLASTFWNQGQWDAAEELFVQVMETRKKKLGADHPDTLTSMANLASTYRNQGRWDAAEELDVQVVETSKKKLGADHPETLTSMANLASTFWDQGRWAAAKELDVQVMETRKKKLGADHPETLTSMANLASTYRNQGQWDAAEELFVQVMETRKKKLGADHPDTLTSMANLASTYRNQGRLDAAEELDVQVMETSKKKLGADHPETLTSMANLASTFWDQGRWDAAEELEVQVMETSKKRLGADHPDTLSSMNNLAFTWEGTGKGTEAVRLMEECLQLRKRVLGVDHPATMSSCTALATWKAEQGNN